MRYIQILLAAFCVLGLTLGAAYAGLNPQDPGLAGGTAVYNPNLSRICTDCHTNVPSAETMRGSHFAYYVGSGLTTRTGGGWTGSLNGPRANGAYFKASMWGTGAWRAWSKYGNTTDNTNRYTATASDNAGMGVTTAIGTAYNSYQIICESCHSLVLNVAGGNNLVAPMTGAYAANTGTATQVNPWSNGDEATLCVGCHGFMYTTNATNTVARYSDTRNNNEVAGSGKKDNNHFHYISGTQYAQNHHVMTGDAINSTMAGAGLLWRDVFVVPPDAAGTVDSGVVRGQMPQQASWVTDGGKAKASTTTYVNCVHCHSAPHTGDITTGASILRDTNAGGTNTGGAMARIGEGGRTWMGMSDVNYCNDCHTLK